MADESTISTVEFNQNARLVFNAETGLDEWVTPKTRMYTVPGVVDEEDRPRPLSMGELVMVVCLERATALENDILAIMAEMNYNTEALNELTSIEEQLVNGKAPKDIKGPFYYQGVKYETIEAFLEALGISNLASVKEALAVLEELKTKLADTTVNVWEIGPISFQGKTYANINDFCNSLNGEFTDWTDAFNAIAEFDQLEGKDGNVSLMGQGDLVQKLHDMGMISQAVYFVWLPLTVGIGGTVSVESAHASFNKALRAAYQDEIAKENTRVQDILDGKNNDDLISQIETKMDSMNSFSQQKMIELQSCTNKRDQSYDMITNILKSLNSTLVGNANNL